MWLSYMQMNCIYISVARMMMGITTIKEGVIDTYHIMKGTSLAYL